MEKVRGVAQTKMSQKIEKKKMGAKSYDQNRKELQKRAILGQIPL